MEEGKAREKKEKGKEERENVTEGKKQDCALMLTIYGLETHLLRKRQRK